MISIYSADCGHVQRCFWYEIDHRFWETVALSENSMLIWNSVLCEEQISAAVLMTSPNTKPKSIFCCLALPTFLSIPLVIIIDSDSLIRSGKLPERAEHTPQSRGACSTRPHKGICLLPGNKKKACWPPLLIISTCEKPRCSLLLSASDSRLLSHLFLAARALGHFFSTLDDGIHTGVLSGHMIPLWPLK